MNESTARADRLGASSPSSPVQAPGYLWEVANKPVSVRINLETVDRLEREVVESFRSLSSRGSEIGGLLLGNVQNGNRISIEGYEAIPCDYVRGPLYQLSEADVERFERAAEQRHAAGGLKVVGFFRSHTRKGLGLDAEDLAFFTGHFREPHQVALLIRPYASKPSTGGIFIYEGGTVRGEASYQEFPFRRSELERMPQPESKPAPDKPAPEAPAAESSSAKASPRAQIVPIASRREIATPAMRTEPEPEAPAKLRFSEKPAAPEAAPAKTESPSHASSFPKPAASQPEEPREELAELVLPPLERPRRGNKMIWVTAGSAAALLLLSGALIYPGFSHKTPRASTAAQGAAGLSLKVEHSGGELLLSWNRDSDAIKNAARGVLAITDGDQHENVNLDIGQLHNGSIVYSPGGSDVSFQLSIVGQNAAQTSSESVRILKTRPSPLADNQPASAPAPQKAPPTPTRPETPAPTTNATAQPAAAPANNAEPTLVADNHSKPAAPTIKEFHPEALSTRLRPPRPTDLPEAPGLTAAAPAPMPVAVPGLGATPGLPVPPMAKSTTPAPARGGQLQQAQLISSKPPDYPVVAKQAHVQGIVVVTATVGVDGKVKSASAVSGPPLLQKAAVDAVKQWVYKPTTLNGAPVESETRVEVRFTNTH
ncbi:MAG TPA: energy transducer TonB [Bryobacteraceae bacterium]|nr:energy transducer TonB [Bryobacteraceae bacterium]